MRLRPTPRLVEAGILVAIVLSVATGVMSLVAGRPGDAWVIVLHGMAGIVLVVLLGWKLRRVAPRLRRRWSRTTLVSVLVTAVAFAAIATGIIWVVGGSVRFLLWNLLNLHVFFGLLLVPLVLIHLRAHLRFPRAGDIEGRRTALQIAVLAGGGVIAWRLQQAIVSLIDTVGSTRRFTGSRAANGTGTDFPVTSWVADDPDPIDPTDWRLRVHGAVATPIELDYDDLPTTETRTATLDCTSGWYADRQWTGVRVGRLLDDAAPQAEAAWVSFRSVTGYRFSLPIGEARTALLATAVGGERLTHGHGFPLRLVAPGRRGFQWVKWVESVEVRIQPDYGQWVAIFASGFT